MYWIRNDVTGHAWKADAAEARLYAIGGVLDTTYSVFKVGGSMSCLTVYEV